MAAFSTKYKSINSTVKLFIIFLLLFFVFTTTQAKDKNVTINFENAPLKSILKSIESQTNYVFFYNNENVSDTKLFSIQSTASPIAETLYKLFNSTGIQYKISDYYIFLSVLNNSEQENSKVDEVIKGTVIDKNQQVIEGVSVINASGIIKAITDKNGYFSFNSSPADTVVTFYLMGYYEKKIPIKNFKSNIVLLNKNVLLNDLVVIGYDKINALELTGSVETLNAELLSKSVNGDLTASFQGQTSGVYVNNDQLRIRGVSSINSSSSPFVVVDGVPQSIALKDLNPVDIESIEVLKDAASAAIYGSRAANGVVLVTTRNSTYNSPTKFTFNASSGINFIVNKPNLLKGKALLKVLDDAYYNKYPERKLLPDGNPIKYFPFSSDYTGFLGYNRNWLNGFLEANSNGQDWSEVLSQPMFFTNYRASLQGGQSQSKYLLSFSYRKNKEFIQGKSNERATLLFKNDYILTPWLNAGFSNNAVVNFANNATHPSTTSAFLRSSLLPVYSPENSEIMFDRRNVNDKKGTNPLYQMTETWDDNVDINDVLTTFIEIKPFKHLTFKSDWSLNFGTRRYRYYQSKDFYREDEAIDQTKSGVILYARTFSYGLNGNNVLTYKPNLVEGNQLKVLVGNNIQTYNSDFNVSRFEGFPTNYFQLTNANTEKVYTRQSAGMDGYRFLSFFTRAQYSLKEKWFAEINARADGTSRFNPTNRWGFFPGLGLSWMLSEEPFLKEISQINYLKTKLSYGFVGNAEMGNFPAQSTAYNWAVYANGAGFVFNNIGNPTVSWEKQRQLNWAINTSLFNDRIQVSLDLYSKTNNDLLINYNIGTFQGYFSSDVTLNSGILTNKGFDFSVLTKNINGAFSWETNFNISHFQTKVLQLSNQQNYIEKGVNRVVVGQPLAIYFLPMWAGVDPTNGHELIYEMTGPEDARVKTGNLLDAELIDFATYNKHRVLINDKSPYPKLFGGITNTFKYKSIEMSFLIYFQSGNWLYHSGMRQASYVSTYDLQNKFASIQNHWTTENPTIQTPLLYNSQMANRESTRYLVDGSYIRLRNVDFRYSLPERISKALYSNSIRIYFQAQNLVTISKFKNGDPEVSNGNPGAEANISPGNVGFNYGMLTLNFGVNFEF